MHVLLLASMVLLFGASARAGDSAHAHGVIERGLAQLQQVAGLEPAWRCVAPCDVPADAHRPPGANPIERVLAADVAVLALRLEMKAELAHWADTRDPPGSRAAAWLIQAEATAQERLNGWPDYPQ